MCFFVNHRIRNQVKSESWYGCERGSGDYVCLFETNTKCIKIFYKEILVKSDIQMLNIFLKYSLYKHFRRDGVNGIISLDYILQLNGSQILNLKQNWKTFGLTFS